MAVKLGTTIYLEFYTFHPITGIVTNADSSATYAVFKNDSSSALSISGGSLVQRTGQTGNYVITLPCTSGNGFTAGDTFTVQVSGTVAGVSNTDTLTNFLVTNYLADEIVQGTDSKVILSNNAHTGATIPTVTNLTYTQDTSGTTTLLGRIPSALTVTTGKVDVNDKTGFSLANDQSAVTIGTVTTVTNAVTISSNTDITKVLGLVLENHVEDDIVRDGNGNKTSSIIYIYNSAANATTHDKVTGLVSKYQITATYSGNNNTLFKSIKL